MKILLEYVLPLLGVAVFGIGYVRNHRNLMLVGAVFLILGDLLRGLLQGFRSGMSG